MDHSIWYDDTEFDEKEVWHELHAKPQNTIREECMPRQSIFDMQFSKVYPLLVQKAERKGRTREEVDAVIAWLTGYDMDSANLDVTCQAFFDNAPAWNPRAELITGKVCGVQVETIKDPTMKRIRQLDKLVDEWAKGKPIERILL